MLSKLHMNELPFKLALFFPSLTCLLMSPAAIFGGTKTLAFDNKSTE